MDIYTQALYVITMSVLADSEFLRTVKSLLQGIWCLDIAVMLDLLAGLNYEDKPKPPPYGGISLM